MNWPAPELLPPPPAPPEPPAPEPTGADDDRRARSGLPAATWIALLGGALVLVAAASVVVSSWDVIGRSGRVLGLILGTGGILVASERLRRPAPSTSNIAAHVGTVLVGSVGVASLSLFGVTWPGCLVAGGALAFAAATWQFDRWRPQLFGAVQVAAIGVASVGAADLTGTTGGVIAALIALAWLATGAERRPAALAALAVVSPALTALADAGIGAGTFERAGLTGDRLGWSGPSVGVLAAMVLAVVARRRRDDGLMVAAAASPVLGLLTGVAAVDSSTLAWWCLPAFVVLASEAAMRMLPARRTAWVVRCDTASALVAGTALLAPAVVGEFDLGTSLTAPWAVPAALTTFAVLLPTARWRRSDHALVDVGIAAVAALVVATSAAVHVPATALAVTAVVATAAAAFLSRRLHRVAICVPAAWALRAIAPLTDIVGDVTWWIAVVLTVATGSIVVTTRARVAADDGPTGWIEVALAVVGLGAFSTLFVDGNAWTALFCGVVVAATAFVLVEPRWTTLQIGALATVGLVTSAPTLGTTTTDAHAWIGWGAATIGLLGVTLVRRSQLAAHAAAASAVVTVAAYAAGVGVTAERAALGSMIAVMLLTGTAMALQWRSPVDTAAITAGGFLALTGAVPIDSVWVSGIWVVLGLQLTTYGAAMRQPTVTAGGALVTALAGVSFVFTTDLDDWVRDLVEPADVTVGDLWMFATATVALVVGSALRRTTGITSWLAYGAGLTIGGLWLVGAQIDRGPVWALPAAVTLGVTAAALGAWSRLAAPLVIGTVITAATTFVAMGSDLRAVPTWTWLALGGASLLGVAVVIERTSQRGTTLRDLIDRWD
ncbi:MAG: hypothetical protein CL424_00885 [Acidimicrobiaceae bacterium]|nr:hypothetical protein [Acidimicrobiaceae bacterium]